MRDLGTIQLKYGSALIYNKQYGAGQEWIQRGFSTFDQLMDSFPNDSAVIRGVISSHVKLAHPLLQANKTEEAVEFLKSALPLAEGLRNRFPNDVSQLDLLAWTQHNLGTALSAKQDREHAAEAFSRAIELRMRARELAPQNDKLMRRLAESQISLGVCQMGMQSSDADTTYLLAIATLQEILERNPKDVLTMISMALAHLNRSNIFAGNDDATGAIDACTDGILLCERVLQADDQHAVARDYASMLYGNRAMFGSHAGDKDQAAADWRKAISLSVSDPTRQFCRLMLIFDLVELSRLKEATEEAQALDAQELGVDNRFLLAQAWATIGAGAINEEAENEECDSATAAPWANRVREVLSELAESEYFKTRPEQRDAVERGDAFATFRKVLGTESEVAELLRGDGSSL